MTKKLEELLNLPDSKEIMQEEKEKAKKEAQNLLLLSKMILSEILQKWIKLRSITQVKGLGELADKELNEVAEKS